MFQPGGRAPYVYHEMRQPLAAILINAQAALRWLNRDVPELDEARQAIACIVGNSLFARDLINEASGIDGALSSTMSQFDLNHVIEEILDLVSLDLGRWDIGVKTDLAAELLPILGNRHQIAQVVAYLAMNSIEAMAAIADRPRMLRFVTSLGTDGRVTLSVTHPGRGLDPTWTSQLSSAPTSVKSGGLDIGLSICRSIVKIHAGRLWAEPDLPHGSTYHVALPIAVNQSTGSQ